MNAMSPGDGFLEHRNNRFYQGLVGLVAQPMQGAAKGGLSGFIKGVGRGMVGVVAKSATGVFDAAAKVSQGYVDVWGVTGCSSTPTITS